MGDQMLQVSAAYGVRGPNWFEPYNKTLALPLSHEIQDAVDNDHETAMWKLTVHKVSGEKLTLANRGTSYAYLMEQTQSQALTYLAKNNNEQKGHVLKSQKNEKRTSKENRGQKQPTAHHGP